MISRCLRRGKGGERDGGVERNGKGEEETFRSKVMFMIIISWGYINILLIDRYINT